VKRLLWAPAALQDLQRLRAFVKKEDPHAALRILKKIRASADLLTDFPDIGRQIPDGKGSREHYTASGRHAYVLRYRSASADSIIIYSGMAFS